MAITRTLAQSYAEVFGDRAGYETVRAWRRGRRRTPDWALFAAAAYLRAKARQLTSDAIELERSAALAAPAPTTNHFGVWRHEQAEMERLESTRRQRLVNQEANKPRIEPTAPASPSKPADIRF